MNVYQVVIIRGVFDTQSYSLFFSHKFMAITMAKEIARDNAGVVARVDKCVVTSNKYSVVACLNGVGWCASSNAVYQTDWKDVKDMPKKRSRVGAGASDKVVRAEHGRIFLLVGTDSYGYPCYAKGSTKGIAARGLKRIGGRGVKLKALYDMDIDSYVDEMGIIHSPAGAAGVKTVETYAP